MDTGMNIMIGGVSLYERFGIVLEDFEEIPPEPKIYQIDNPGGDSTIDLTEVLSGDISYNDRSFEFIFFITRTNYQAFSTTKSLLMSFLHGKEFTFSLSWDAGYTYTGRFKVNEIKTSFTVGRVVLEVTAKPYKSGGFQVVEVSGQTGSVVHLTPGRGRVQPVFESDMPLHVIGNGVDVQLPAGSNTAVGLFIKAGASDVYVNSGASVRGGTLTYADLKTMTYAEMKTYRWYQLYYLNNKPEGNPVYNVRIGYEIKEL